MPRRPTARLGMALVATCVLLAPAGASAQGVSPTGRTVPAAESADVQSIDAILAAVYEVISGPAGQARNWDRFRSLFLPEAKLIPTGFPEGSDRARAGVFSVEQYIERSGPILEGQGFFEREIGRVTEQFENIAHAFSTYESRRTPEGEVFQRGINSIQLLWDGERWWVVNIMWRGVAADVAIPEPYLRRR